MRWLKKIFCRRKQFKPQPKQLRIDGCKTVMTAAPDDSELAAQAFLESLAGASGSKVQGSRLKVKDQKKGRKQKDNHAPLTMNHAPEAHDAAYYQELSGRIKLAHEQERRSAMRYVAYVEQELARVKEPGFMVQDSSNHEPLTVNHEPEAFAFLEHELYKHQDAVEREGGELLRRWQKCLAECILKQTSAAD